MKLSKKLTTVTPFSKYLAMALFILLPISTFYFGMKYQQALYQLSNAVSTNTVAKFSSTQQPAVYLDNEWIVTKKNAIETKYPDLRNFENQKSFGGKSVITAIRGDDYYFAYIIHGSGVPIIQATCFLVDKNSRVFKVKEFPDLGHDPAPYAPYKDIIANCNRNNK